MGESAKNQNFKEKQIKNLRIGLRNNKTQDIMSKKIITNLRKNLWEGKNAIKNTK